MLGKEDIGKFYVSIPRGQRGEFIICISNELPGSFTTWRRRLMSWSKGELGQKPLSHYFIGFFEALMAEDRWGTKIVCTQ